MYKVDVKVKDPDNVTHAIGGVQYQFTSPEKDRNFHYWGRGRVEYSDFKKWYGQFGAGANYTKNKNYKSVEFNVFPVETGPGHSKKIYEMRLNLYADYYFFDMLNTSLSLEGSHFTDSRGNRLFHVEKSYEAAVTAKIGYDRGEERKSKFIPFIEGTRTQASIGESTVDLSIGYPYWMIDDRLFYGAGVGWKYGLGDGNVQAKLEATYFLDDYTDQFQRVTGELAWQIFDYTLLTAGFEAYIQEKYYSNAVRLGIKYNLKKRKKK
jgi:hypothetical protein